VKIVDEVGLALDSAIGQLANLLRVKSLPGLLIQVFVQRHNKQRVDHVYESVAYIATVLQVNRQIEEVVPMLVLFINPFK
jgi:hypothetical protein